MAISYTQELHYSCPACGAVMACEAWVLIDTHERSDLRQALLDNDLNTSACINCQAVSAPDGPLLLHEAATQQVYFAVPASVGEHAWREYAQELLHALLQALPEEQHLSYLGDVQIEQGLDGVRSALTRRSRRTNRRQATPGGHAQDVLRPQTAQAATSRPDSELVEAIEALLACDSSAELEEMVYARAVLREPAAVIFITSMIDTAEKQADIVIAQALRHARSVLLGIQQGHKVEARAILEAEPDDSIVDDMAQVSQAALSDLAYQAVLSTDSPEALREVERDYPQLLEPWAEHALAQRLEAALDIGHEHLAAAIEERSVTLADLRSELMSDAQIRVALKALASAKTEETLLEAINAYPALLTEAVQHALSEIHARTLARGEEQRAALIDGRRKMLNDIRQGLETV